MMPPHGHSHRRDDETTVIDEARTSTMYMRQEFLLDEALKETFPASDPISMSQFT